MESIKITTSCLCSTKRLAFSITISATWTWRVAGSSKVEATTSPLTMRCISVTSSGRSSISKTMRVHSGLLLEIEWATFCNKTVLPALGGATIRPRWPLPIGATRSMTRAVKSSLEPLPNSKRILLSGKSGVKFSKRILLREFSGLSKLTVSTFRRAK